MKRNNFILPLNISILIYCRIALWKNKIELIRIFDLNLCRSIAKNTRKIFFFLQIYQNLFSMLRNCIHDDLTFDSFQKLLKTFQQTKTKLPSCHSTGLVFARSLSHRVNGRMVVGVEQVEEEFNCRFYLGTCQPLKWSSAHELLNFFGENWCYVWVIVLREHDDICVYAYRFSYSPLGFVGRIWRIKNVSQANN